MPCEAGISMWSMSKQQAIVRGADRQEQRGLPDLCEEIIASVFDQLDFTLHWQAALHIAQDSVLQQWITIRNAQYAMRIAQPPLFESINHWDALQIVKYAIRWGQHTILNTQVFYSVKHWNEEYGDSLIAVHISTCWQLYNMERQQTGQATETCRTVSFVQRTSRKKEKRKVYAVRHHSGSLCLKRQPKDIRGRPWKIWNDVVLPDFHNLNMNRSYCDVQNKPAWRDRTLATHPALVPECVIVYTFVKNINTNRLKSVQPWMHNTCRVDVGSEWLSIRLARDRDRPDLQGQKSPAAICR